MMPHPQAFLTSALVALLVTQVATLDRTVNTELDDEIKLAPTNYRQDHQGPPKRYRLNLQFYYEQVL